MAPAVIEEQIKSKKALIRLLEYEIKELEQTNPEPEIFKISGVLCDEITNFDCLVSSITGAPSKALATDLLVEKAETEGLSEWFEGIVISKITHDHERCECDVFSVDDGSWHRGLGVSQKAQNEDK